MKRLRHALALIGLSTALCLGYLGARADVESELAAPGGLDASAEELEAWYLAQTRNHIRAREKAERVVRANPDSYVGHLVLGYVHHYGEANLPRSLFHLQKALALFEAQHGSEPTPDAPWRWHANLIKELAWTHGDLEHHADKLAFIARYNRLYTPDMIAERAWPLMKMGRYQQARQAAEAALATDRATQHSIALNALCAIEFEAGNDGASYEACMQAVDHAKDSGGRVSAVDLTNFAEASRSLFKLDEAERVSLEATQAQVSWYGNPWMELAALYTREGRFAEALSALKEVPRYRAQRPPHVRDSDRNEARRVAAAFFVVIGRPKEAIDITDKALVAPDRRAHNSRDPAQDRLIVALLDRRARRLAAQMRLERAAARPWYEWPLAWFEAGWLRVQAWHSGTASKRLLAEDRQRLEGILRIGTARSAIMPPWLVGELVDVLGAGVLHDAIARARRQDERPGAAAYYDAFEAETRLHAGELGQALALGERALGALGPRETLLRARVSALAADAARRLGQASRAARHYDAAFQEDPGVFRRLEIPLPVRIEATGDAVARAVADNLAWSPRLDATDEGLLIRVEARAAGGRVCLLGHHGQVLGCGRAQPEGEDAPERFATRLTDAFHEQVFSPPIDLSQADISSLDGANLTGREALDDAFDELQDGF